MPADGNEPLTDDEVAIIKWWIEQGAKKDFLVGELDAPDSLLLYGETIIARVSPERKAELDEERRVLYAQVDALNQKLDILLIPKHAASKSLILNTVYDRKKFTDAHFNQLLPFAANIISLDLSRTAITDASIPAISSFNQLKTLVLRDTDITGTGFETLGQLLKLETLVLYGTGISDEHLDMLQIESLKRIYLGNTKVSEAKLAEYRKLMPSCEVLGDAAARILATNEHPTAKAKKDHPTGKAKPKAKAKPKK